MRVVRGHQVVMFFVLTILFFLGGERVRAAGPTVITSDISVATTWTKENSPYIVSNAITINAPFSLEPGVIVKFNNNAVNNTPATLVVKNDVSVVGTAEEKIVLTSVCDDAYGGDTKSYSTRCNSGPLYLEWGGISLNNTSAHVAIEHTLIFRASRGISYQTNVQNIPYRGLSVKYTEIRQSGSGILLRNTLPMLSFNTFEGNTYGMEVTTSMSDRVPVIRDSSFLNNGVAIRISSPGTTTVDARFNWWGDATGTYFQSNNPMLDNSGGLGNRVIQPLVKFRPWLENVPSDVSLCSDCASNVLFLPGIKGSKLYKDDGSADGDTLWLPTVLSNDVEELGMDENGQSVNTIYTKDILATIPFGSLYESFLEKLNDLKYAGTINDYQSFAYDWRKNVEDILYDGALYPEGVLKSLVTDAEVLARTSKTRKVAIIAHSNGGLLAKALMLELEKRGLENNIETIVFVGAPQMGTPLAVLSLLYGYDEPIPALLSQAKARTLAENMPGAYGLLPSEEYFNRMTDPFITFSSEHTRYKDFQDAYGESIGDYWEGYSFLHGDDDGRDKPAANDTETENILNDTLMYQARNTHSRLDAWVPPNDVNVIEIAGWGLDTVSGIRYTEKSLAKCYYSGTSVPSCVNEGQYEPVYDPQFTVDGDAVVVASSALMMSDAGNIKRYWMDLYKYNDNNAPDRKHRDLLETDSLQVFLSSIITKNTSAALPEFISTARPDDYASAKPRLRMALYSPLDVHLYDTHGNHTGPKKTLIDGQEVTIFEESIPNSYYYQFGERKYVGFPKGEKIRVEMDGYDLGAYTLKLSEIQMTTTGEEELVHTTFESLPTTADTLVKFSFSETGIAGMSLLEADVDGNGTRDYSVAPVLNGVATFEESDTTPPTTVATLAGTNGAGSWYTSDVTVTLAATDNEGGSGVEKTEYSLDGGATWNVYSEPFVVTSEGTTTFQYFSADKAGNKEIAKTETIQIDKTAPEGKIMFNSTTQKIVVTGTDNLGGTVPVEMFEQPQGMLATLTDEAGHTTNIAFERQKDHKGYATVRVKTLAYDEGESISLRSSAAFKWHIDRKNQYQQLASYLRVGAETFESRFMSKKNETWIRERIKEYEDDSFEKNEEDEVGEQESGEWQKLSGLVVPYLETAQGKIETRY